MKEQLKPAPRYERPLLMFPFYMGSMAMAASSASSFQAASSSPLSIDGLQD